MAKTLHVYPSDGRWAVKKEGQPASIFRTKREAVVTAVHRGRRAKSAQVVVHGKDGRILEYRAYGMPKIQEPPRKGRLASRTIAAAVGKIVLDRLRDDGEHASEK
jgi:hypothetical protein